MQYPAKALIGKVAFAGLEKTRCPFISGEIPASFIAGAIFAFLMGVRILFIVSLRIPLMIGDRGNGRRNRTLNQENKEKARDGVRNSGQW
ncbi:hypothetical protein [Methanoregula sp.]|uniref:hypothetical protein n=1 Tax=Methanoregula sp. TaxID=2052170 RepID=UPI0035673DA6